MKTKKRLFYILMLLPFALVLLSLPFLPDQVPAHYGSNSQVTRWGSKYELLLLPTIIIGFGAFLLSVCRFLARCEKDGSNNASACLLTGIILLLAFTCMTGYLLFAAFRQVEDLSTLALGLDQLLTLLIALLLIATGNVMPKLRMNSVFGLRTTWSVKNETVWKKCQRFGGITFIAAGLVLLPVGLFVRGLACELVMLLLLVAVSVIDVVYSYKISQKY